MSSLRWVDVISSTTNIADIVNDDIAVDVNDSQRTNEEVKPTMVIDDSEADVDIEAAALPAMPDSLPVRKSSRVHVPSNLLKNYDCRGMPNLHSIKTTPSTSPHTLPKVFSYNLLSSEHYIFSSRLDNSTLPTTYNEAVKHQC